MTRTRCPDPRCPACHHDASLHRHIRDGGCQAVVKSPHWSGHWLHYRCGCTRNPAAADVELDDPSEDVIAGQERRDEELRQEEP